MDSGDSVWLLRHLQTEALQKGKAREWLHFCFDLAEVMSNTEKSEPHKSTYVSLMPVLST